MVKLYGPCLSLEAAGKLSDALAFSTTKQGTYLKKNQAPAQPRTQKQLTARAIVTWLSRQWSFLTDPQKATWTVQAQHLHVARYHAFIAYNCDRWNNFLAPSKEYPATETGPAPNNPAMFATAKIKSATIRISAPSGAQPWGHALQRNTTGIGPPTHDDVVHFILQDMPFVVRWTDTPLETGTYYYKCQPFNDTGLKGGGSTVRTVIIA